jgi:hypothetical protein
MDPYLLSIATEQIQSLVRASLAAAGRFDPFPFICRHLLAEVLSLSRTRTPHAVSHGVLIYIEEEKQIAAVLLDVIQDNEQLRWVLPRIIDLPLASGKHNVSVDLHDADNKCIPT